MVAPPGSISSATINSSVSSGIPNQMQFGQMPTQAPQSSMMPPNCQQHQPQTQIMHQVPMPSNQPMPQTQPMSVTNQQPMALPQQQQQPINAAASIPAQQVQPVAIKETLNEPENEVTTAELISFD